MFSKRLDRHIGVRDRGPVCLRGMFVVAVGRKGKNLEESVWSPAWPLSSRGYLVPNGHCDLRYVAVFFSSWISFEQRGRILTRMRMMKWMW